MYKVSFLYIWIDKNVIIISFNVKKNVYSSSNTKPSIRGTIFLNSQIEAGNGILRQNQPFITT